MSVRFYFYDGIDAQRRPGLLDVVYEDNHCLVINKPAGLLSQGDDTGEVCVVDLAKDYLKRKYQKPGNVYVGLIHRLDRPTSGLVLLARTSKAAARLSEQFRDGIVEKTYWAIVEGVCPSTSGTWHDWLKKDRSSNVVSAVRPNTPDAVEALVDYRVLERTLRRTWIELKPRTGRSHQLRVQLSARSLPIVGDRKYGARSTLPALDGGSRVALHAQSLSFNHPTRADRMTCSVPIPEDWPKSSAD